MNGKDFDTLDNQSTMPGDVEGKLLASRYRIIRKLGEGGMGMVYLAEDVELDNEKVAIKFVPPPLANSPRAIRGLQREARTARRLAHPNIVKLHDLHTDGRQKFLVMEYVAGRTLDDVLAEKKTGRLTLDELLPIAEQVAQALDYAHGQGLTHRDLKPSNIMVTFDGHVRLLDFGIAREMKDTLTRVTGKESSGTLPYMSPEQLLGEPPSRQMDIYSLAAVLYECLAGHPPFHTGDIREQVKSKGAPPLENVHPRVNYVILSALAKDPSQRPNSSVELVEMLGGEPGTAAHDEVKVGVRAVRVLDRSARETTRRPNGEPIEIADARALGLSTFSQNIDFASDACGLHVGDGPCGVTSIEDRAYVMAAKPEDYLGYEISALPRMTEFVAQARIRKLEGPHDQWSGFEFGERYPGNYYQCLLNGKGVVKVSKHWQQEWSDLGYGDNLTHVRRGDMENLLFVARKDGEIHVFVNDYHALTVQDTDVRIGGLGLMVGMGVRAAFNDLRVEGVELAAVFERAITHWEGLEVREAKRLFEYVHGYEPRYKHPKCPVDVSHLLAEPRPDRSKSIIIAIASEALPQIYDSLIALKLKQEVDRRGSAEDLEFACIVTDAALLVDKRWLECPLISVGGPVVNKVTADLVDKLPVDPIVKGAVRIQHNIKSREKRVALWGDLRAHSEEAVDLFISSGLLDRFLNMIWGREFSNRERQ